MSGLIPQPFIDSLLHRVDLIEFIDSYLPLKKRGSSYIACCPFHNEKTPSFNVIAKKQFYHCFGCGVSGNAISFAMAYLNLGFKEAVETLARRVGLTLPSEGQINTQGSDLYQLLRQVSVYYQENLKKKGAQVLAYLRLRGVDEAIANQYQLGFALPGWHQLEKAFPHHQSNLIAAGMLVEGEDGKRYDRYRQRLIFPIHDRHGRIIGFGGRVLEKGEQPKYLNSPETVIFQKSRELYGLHQVLNHKEPRDCIILVEGYMDVIALAQHGFHNVVATLGTAPSTYHVQLLAKHTTRLVCCFDGDSAGRQAAWRALEASFGHLNEGLDVGFVFLPEGEDPDSLIRKEGSKQFKTRLEQGIPLHRFFFDRLMKGINLRHPSGKTQLIHLAKPFLQKMSEGSYKHLLLEELAQRTRIPADRLHALISETNTSLPIKNNMERSPLRIALALLLQHPEIYSQSAASISLNLLDKSEHRLFIELVEGLRLRPEINTAALLELWRHTQDFALINQLAAWDHQVPEKERIKEFIDIVSFLQRQNEEQSIQKLLDKSRSQGLTGLERNNLQEMLKKRHKPENAEK